LQPAFSLLAGCTSLFFALNLEESAVAQSETVVDPSALEAARAKHAERCRRLGFDAEQTASYWEGCNQQKLAEREQKKWKKIA